MTISTTRRDYLTFIDTLISEYCSLFPNDKARLSVLIQQLEKRDPDICLRSNLPGHLTASALVLDERKQALLLIEHKFLQRWLQPGGHMDLDELPVNGALRELSEEVGPIPVTIHPWHTATRVPIDIDSHQIPANPKKGEQEHLHHDFQYIMLLNGDSAITLQADEVSAHRWVSINDFENGEYGQRLARTVRKMRELEFFQGGPDHEQR